MRRAVICLAALAALTVPAAADAAKSKAPTAAQIQAAVSDAESSTFLWATVNVCVAQGAGGEIGIRGEMPSLGFASVMTMTIQLQRYDSSSRTYTAITGPTATRTVTVGRLATGVHQSGAEFPFAADPGPVAASVTFTWTRAGQTLGTVTQQTTSGHPSAAYGRPAHHSAASCALGSTSS